MRYLTCAMIAVVFAGCASSPAPAPTTVAAAPIPMIGPVVPAPGAPPVATPVATTATQAVDAPKKAPPGYKLVQRDGETLFCTRIATLGTKFKQEFCFTEEQYAETQRRGENARQDLRRTTSMCGGGNGPFSCSGAE